MREKVRELRGGEREQGKTSGERSTGEKNQLAEKRDSGREKI